VGKGPKEPVAKGTERAGRDRSIERANAVAVRGGSKHCEQGHKGGRVDWAK